MLHWQSNISAHRYNRTSLKGMPLLRVIPIITFHDVYFSYVLYIQSIYLTHIMTFYLAYSGILSEHILIFYLAFFLTYILPWYVAFYTFFLAYIQTLSVTFQLRFSLTFSMTYIYIYYSILSGILFCTVCDILRFYQALSGYLSGILANSLFGILSIILCSILL